MIRLLGSGGLFLCNMVLVRSLGISGYGEYAEAIAWLQILCVVGKFGFDNATLRFVAEYTTRGEPLRLNGFRRLSTRFVVVTSTIVMALVGVATCVCWNLIGSQFATCLLIAAVMVPLISLRQIQESSLRGGGHLLESQIGTVVWPVSLLLLAGTTWVIIPGHLSSPLAMAFHLVSMLVVSAMVFHFFARSRPLVTSTPPDSSCRGLWMKTAAAFVLVELLIALKSRICVLMAGRLLGSEAAGLYGAMDRFADATALGCQSIGFVIAPQFASLFASGRYQEMRGLLRTGSLLCLASTLPIAWGILLFRNQIFAVMGLSDLHGDNLLFMVMTSASIIALSGPSGYVLQMTGRENILLAITGLCATTNIVCGLLLMNSLGLEGLGLSQIITSCVWTISLRGSLAFHPAWRLNPSDSKSPRSDRVRREVDP